MNLTILIQLLLAHILADFVFQSNGMVESKKKDGLNQQNFGATSFFRVPSPILS